MVALGQVNYASSRLLPSGFQGEGRRVTYCLIADGGLYEARTFSLSAVLSRLRWRLGHFFKVVRCYSLSSLQSSLRSSGFPSSDQGWISWNSTIFLKPTLVVLYRWNADVRTITLPLMCFFWGVLEGRCHMKLILPGRSDETLPVPRGVLPNNRSVIHSKHAASQNKKGDKIIKSG